MSIYHPSRLLPRQFRLILTSFLCRSGLPFADVITEASIKQALADEEVAFAEGEDAVYTPAITLWAFLSQALHKGEHRSCVAAVARVAVLLVALERGSCSSNTGAYCRARGKLSESVIRRLSSEVADGCERQVKDKWLWHGRHVQLVDGTTISMPDTKENQEAYPQHPQQEQGLGFPIARVVVLLSLATAMVTGMAMGPYAGKETGETALFRQMIDHLQPGDILLADRYYCSYFMTAMLLKAGADFVTRVHQRREIDFRRGQRLGKGDHIIEWSRPQRPDWMDQEIYDQMPTSIQVREIEVQVDQPGFRVDSFVVVTTLLDARTYSQEDIAELYGYRWQAELDIRAIKDTMGMDVLRCKSPAMIRKEAWACVLAYNLIRRSMLQSAEASGQSPRQLSYSAALQGTAANWQVIVVSSDTIAAALVEAAIANMAQHVVGNRPNRVEPREVKRRPKPHNLLTRPRDQARAELLARRAS